MNQSLLILDAFSLLPGEPACRALAGVLENANAGRLPRFAQWLGLAEPLAPAATITPAATAPRW
ncbi:hypothetical protein ACU4GI_22055 [Cupriavidus basilensis]